MQYYNDTYLEEAIRSGRFEPIAPEYHIIQVYEDGIAQHEVYHDSSSGDAIVPLVFLTSDLDQPKRERGCTKLGSLRCVYHTCRPNHVSGQPDRLPFRDASAFKTLFSGLNLPMAYLQISEGSPSLVQSNIIHDRYRHPVKYEFIAHCITKQGDWAMALSHIAADQTTSVFWSVDRRMESESLLRDLLEMRELACHPMLIPCIMFAQTLQASQKRRQSIKAKLRCLDEGIQNYHERTSKLEHGRPPDSQWSMEQTQDLDHLFELLHSCRREQASREGRYQLWLSYHTAISEGLDYSDLILADVPGQKLSKAHSELKQLARLLWQRFESLRARDIDHVNRIDNISETLYNAVQRRDSQIQLDIARATQRDSEDVKFITLLGCIFLPASLIAIYSLLNVQEFQFLPGGKLFGVYIGVTIPFVALIVTVCVARPVVDRWKGNLSFQLRPE